MHHYKDTLEAYINIRIFKEYNPPYLPPGGFYLDIQVLPIPSNARKEMDQDTIIINGTEIKRNGPFLSAHCETKSDIARTLICLMALSGLDEEESVPE